MSRIQRTVENDEVLPLQMGGKRGVFIYMQILHVNNVKTTNQTFGAKFYFRATWVQKKPTETEAKDVQHCFADKQSWPPGVYRPNIGFDNAVDDIELKGQSIEMSKWRIPKKHVAGDSSDTSEECVVMEWKARGSGNFSHDFDWKNYPMDIQLLKITIGILDINVLLYDDNADGVQSTIRKDYYVDNGFAFVPYKELLGDNTVEEENGKEAHGMPITSKQKTFVINPLKNRECEKREFTNLSYIIPSRRFWVYPIQETFIPVALISFSAFAVFLFPPQEVYTRLSVFLAVLIILSVYSYKVSICLPKMKEPNMFMKHTFHSFVHVFLVMIVTMIYSSCVCSKVYCNEDEIVAAAIERMDKIDIIIFSTFLVLWILLNFYSCLNLVRNYIQNEKERVGKELLHEDEGSKLSSDSVIPFTRI